MHNGYDGAFHIYGDESGQVGGKHFLVGLLFVESRYRSEYERQLQRLKLERRFTYRELHYNELNRSKSDFAKAVVDWYFRTTGAVFKCTVVPGALFDVRRFSGNLKFMSDEELSYNVIYKSAVNFHSSPQERRANKVLILDAKDKARPDEFQDFLMKNIPGVVDMQEAASEDHNLLQVVDLLTGCVNGDLNDVQKFDKRTVVDYIKARLNIVNFRERNHYTQEKFRVAFWKPAA